MTEEPGTHKKEVLAQPPRAGTYFMNALLQACYLIQSTSKIIIIIIFILIFDGYSMGIIRETL
jgi:hypothetical protein